MIALYIVAFILFVLLVLYPCGAIILRAEKNFIIKLNIGVVVSVIIYFVLGLLKLNFLIIPVLLFPLIYLIFKKEYKIPKFKTDWLVILVIVFVTLIQGSINFTSGDIVNGGIRLINIHNQDSLWMIALTESVERGIPPSNPGFPQTLVQNYHYFLNIFIAIAQIFTNIPIITLYLKIIGPFLLLLFSATTYIFIKKLTGSRFAGIGGVFILSLASNLYYFVGLFYPQANLTPSIFWVNEYETHIVNYQLLLSYSLLLTWFYLLLQKNRSILLLAILGGSLIAFKSFASVVLIPSIWIVGLIDLFKKKYFLIKLAILTSLFTLIFYFCSNPTFQSQFIVQPLYFIETMFVTADHINYPDWILKIQTYVVEGNYKRIIQFYSEGILLFVIGNLGLRVFGFTNLFKNTVTKLLGLISIFGIVASLLLVSKGVAWNSIQFTYYSVFATSILFICFLKNIEKKNKILAVGLFIIGWVSLLPGVWVTTQSYLSQVKNPVTNQEIYNASIFLSHLPKGIVRVDPAYSQTSFVAAISDQETFLTNPSMLDVQLINYKNAKPENIKYVLGEKDGRPVIYQLGSSIPLQ